MKSNKLLLVNGIVSIIAGILIIYFSLQRSSFEFVDLIVSFIENYIWALLIMLINVFLLILSLAGMSHYSGDSRVNKMNHQMLLFASIMEFIPFLAFFAGVIPFLGEAAGLLALISGSFYLQDFQKIKSEDKAD